jgi:hypothetical protein
MMQGPTTLKNETPETLVPAPAASSKNTDFIEADPEPINIKAHREDERILVNPPADPEPHRQRVTLLLICLLGGLIFVHYAGMFCLDWNGKKLENVSNAFSATLPVISGLTGAAVTYYFTRRSDK